MVVAGRGMGQRTAARAGLGWARGGARTPPPPTGRKRAPRWGTAPPAPAAAGGAPACRRAAPWAMGGRGRTRQAGAAAWRPGLPRPTPAPRTLRPPPRWPPPGATIAAAAPAIARGARGRALPQRRRGPQRAHALPSNPAHAGTGAAEGGGPGPAARPARRPRRGAPPGRRRAPRGARSSPASRRPGPPPQGAPPHTPRATGGTRRTCWSASAPAPRACPPRRAQAAGPGAAPAPVALAAAPWRRLSLSGGAGKPTVVAGRGVGCALGPPRGPHAPPPTSPPHPKDPKDTPPRRRADRSRGPRDRARSTCARCPTAPPQRSPAAAAGGGRAPTHRERPGTRTAEGGGPGCAARPVRCPPPPRLSVCFPLARAQGLGPWGRAQAAGPPSCGGGTRGEFSVLTERARRQMSPPPPPPRVIPDVKRLGSPPLRTACPVPPGAPTPGRPQQRARREPAPPVAAPRPAHRADPRPP
jgi:hypothetical protein